MEQLKNIEWWSAAGARSIKTFAQTMVSMLTIGQAVAGIDWLNIVSVSAVASMISILTSLAGLPEVCDEDRED